MAALSETPLLYTLNEAAALVRGNRTTIYRAADQQQVQLVCRGRRRFVTAQSLHAWIEKGLLTDPVRDNCAQ